MKTKQNFKKEWFVINKFWKFKDSSLNSEEGELYLYGEIASEESWWSDDIITYREFIKDLKGLGVKQTIKVYINSGGGDVFAANAIYTQLKANSAKIHIIIEGICASAATIVAMAGDKIIISNSAVIMIHNPKVGVMGYYEQKDLEKLNTTLETIKNSIIATYKTKLNKTDEQLKELMDNETWYTGKEAVENGIADELMFSEVDSFVDGNLLFVNNIQCDINKFKNIPANLKNKVADKNSTTFFNIKKEEGKDVEIKNVEDLVKNYPDLVNEIVEKTKKVSVSEEQERLKAIDEISAQIPKDLVQDAKYKNYITAEQLAFEALKKNTAIGMNFYRDMQEDSNASGVGNLATKGEKDEQAQKQEKVNNLVNFLNKDKRRFKQWVRNFIQK